MINGCWRRGNSPNVKSPIHRSPYKAQPNNAINCYISPYTCGKLYAGRRLLMALLKVHNFSVRTSRVRTFFVVPSRRCCRQVFHFNNILTRDSLFFVSFLYFSFNVCLSHFPGSFERVPFPHLVLHFTDPFFLIDPARLRSHDFQKI